MAYNPPLNPQGFPCKVDGEIFVLQRKDIECEFKCPNNKDFGKKTAKGNLYMTTCRIVFVNEKYQKDIFKAFDIPLANLRKESFEQPVFGSNYLKGVVLPLFNLIPGPCEFKLWFKSGGCGTFLKMIDSVLKQVRRNRGKGPDQRFVNDVQTGKIANQQALFDPNDPSTIFVTQPQDQVSQQQQGEFYGPNVQGNPYYQIEPQPQPNQFNQPPQNNNQQFQQPPQQQQFQQQPQQQGQFQQYQPQPQQQGQQFQQYQPQPQQQGQFQQYQPQQQQQFQPVQQQNGQFQQYNQNQNQYQNNPVNQQNFNQNPQQQQQIQQINQPNLPQPQQEQKYFGFWGPTLQNNDQQQQQQQQFQQQQQYQQVPQQNQFQQYNQQQQPNNNNNNYPQQ